MKVIDKIALAIFSIIVLIISLIYILMFFGVLDVSQVADYINLVLVGNISKKVCLVVAFVNIILAFKVIFFEAEGIDNIKMPIEIKSEQGILEITPNTIENITNIALNNYTSISDSVSKMKSAKNGIIINIICTVLPETNITELVVQIQKNIKEKIEKQTSATVVEVNVRIKDLKKVKKVEEV